MDKKRKVVQFLSAIISNAHLKGFWTGQLYQGAGKGFCTPGLNCYSCPAAIASCPLGALQNSLMTLRRGVNTLTIGILMLFGLVFGRFICGWLCPFGLLQDLLYKIPSPKKKCGFRRLKWVKYLVLSVFVIGIPVGVALSRGIGIPGFCKYICPQGTLGGAVLVWTNERLQDLMGVLFGWKVFVLVVILAGSVFVFRPFCRVLCPLGAIYGLFNRIALVQIRHDPAGCTGCGRCQAACPVELQPVTEHNSTECIRCGKCTAACGTGAIRLMVLPDPLHRHVHLSPKR